MLTRKLKGEILCHPWPIDTDEVRFRQRKHCKKFVFAYGNGGPFDRKGGLVVAEAARLAPDVPLIVYSQVQDGYDSGKNLDVSWPSTIDFRGSARSISKIYEEGDVFLLPSRFEGLGLPLFESQAAGMPLITTDGPPMNEANPWKLLPCDPRNIELAYDYLSWDVSPQSLVDAMRAALDVNIEEASQSARNWVLRNRSWKTQAQAIREKILCST